MKPLTSGQAAAMYVLLQGAAIGTLVRTGKESSYETSTSSSSPRLPTTIPSSSKPGSETARF